MIYGNTGAGLVDVDVPQSPLYQQALPNLRDVSAAAWGLPSLDDISVPDVTTEKDIQTDTDLTQKYFDLATKLKDYAVKGRSVGIDVTKPKNNPTHLQFSQEWNKMYQEFLQTGKELKGYRQNQLQFEKGKLNPETISGSPDATQPFTSELLGKYQIEDPFVKIKGLQKAYSKPIAIYDQNQYQSYLQRWKDDFDFVNNQIEESKIQHPELADKIEMDGAQIRESLIPPMYDSKFAAKLALDMQQHKDKMRLGYSNLGLQRDKFENLKSQQEVAGGTFEDKLEFVLNKPNTPFSGSFGILQYNSFGKVEESPRTLITVKGSDLSKYGVTKGVDKRTKQGVPLKEDKYYVIVYDGDKIDGVYGNDEVGKQALADRFKPAYGYKEKQIGQQIGTYDFTDDNGYYNVEANQQDVPVQTKTTNTQSEKATTIKKTKEYKATTTVKSR
jgi:hypothetical protein